VQTFEVTVGIRGPGLVVRYSPMVRQLDPGPFRVGLTAVQTDSLMRALVSQTLTELTELYSVRYAALQQHHRAPNS
jgi:hypothetical protein